MHGVVDQIINKMPLGQFMHKDDRMKKYKLRLVKHVRELEAISPDHLEGIVKHIQQNHHTPAWFELYLPGARCQGRKRSGW